MPATFAQLRYCLLLAVLLLTSACASSIFLPYSQRAELYRQDLSNNRLDSSLKQIEASRFGLDKQLTLVEHGRLAQLNGQIDTSIQDFQAAIALVTQRENQARIDLSTGAQDTLSLLSNDNSRSYQLDIYEQVLLYQYQAFNYLLKRDLSAAGVEVRRANYVQQNALKNYSSDAASQLSDLQKQQLTDQAALAQVQNSFENAYSYYFSALIYQALGDYNNAYIDYKKALGLAPANPAIQTELIKLARQQGYEQDYRRFKQRFNLTPQKIPANAGRLVILYEQNLVPKKITTGFNYFSRHGALPVTVPVYPVTWQPSTRLQIFQQSQIGQPLQHLGQTALLADIHALAAKSLAEKMPSIILREGLRAVSKYELQKKANKENSGLGIGLQIFNLLTAQADVRSWLTLPSNAQVFSQYLPAGQHQLNFASNRQQQNYAVDITAGQTTIIRVTEPGNHFYIQTVRL